MHEFTVDFVYDDPSAFVHVYDGPIGGDRLHVVRFVVTPISESTVIGLIDDPASIDSVVPEDGGGLLIHDIKVHSSYRQNNMLRGCLFEGMRAFICEMGSSFVAVQVDSAASDCVADALGAPAHPMQCLDGVWINYRRLSAPGLLD